VPAWDVSARSLVAQTDAGNYHVTQPPRSHNKQRANRRAAKLTNQKGKVMITRTPKWAKGMRKLMPGVYEDASHQLHVSEAEICEHFGVPYTKENSAVIEETVEAALREVFGKVPPITKVESPEEHL